MDERLTGLMYILEFADAEQGIAKKQEAEARKIRDYMDAERKAAYAMAMRKVITKCKHFARAEFLYDLKTRRSLAEHLERKDDGT